MTEPAAGASVAEDDDDPAGFDDEFEVVAVDGLVGPPAILDEPVLTYRGDRPARPVHDDRVRDAGRADDYAEGSGLVETS